MFHSQKSKLLIFISLNKKLISKKNNSGFRRLDHKPSWGPRTRFLRLTCRWTKTEVSFHLWHRLFCGKVSVPFDIAPKDIMPACTGEMLLHPDTTTKVWQVHESSLSHSLLTFTLGTTGFFPGHVWQYALGYWVLSPVITMIDSWDIPCY